MKCNYGKTGECSEPIYTLYEEEDGQGQRTGRTTLMCHTHYHTGTNPVWKGELPEPVFRELPTPPTPVIEAKAPAQYDQSHGIWRHQAEYEKVDIDGLIDELGIPAEIFGGHASESQADHIGQSSPVTEETEKQESKQNENKARHTRHTKGKQEE